MRPSRKPRIILIFLIALCGLFVHSYTARLAEKSRVEAQIIDMQARIEEAKSEQYELLEELEALSRPDYIDRVARSKFGYAQPGDKVLMMIQEPTSSPLVENVSAVAEAITSVDLRNLPVWQQWVVFFATEAYSLPVPK
jgi:cell division protein FtsB